MTKKKLLIAYNRHNPQDKRTIGMLAEWVALFYLMTKGYRPLKWRYRTPYAEIDWLMRKGSCLVVVEVKYRHVRQFMPALGSIQQLRLMRAMNWSRRYFRFPEARLDLLVLSLQHRPIHYMGLTSEDLYS